jgi:glycosyltransferase involved in cell wall biosynthesis
MRRKSLSVAVVIPVYNGGQKFRACIDSIRRTVPPPDEFIVVGDGDIDGSSQLAEAAGASVYRFPSPGGPGRARNLGAAKALSDVLFFIDADVTVPPDAISRVRELLGKDANLAAVIGSYDDEPGEQNFLSQYRNLLHHFVHQNSSERASTFWGACGAIRRSVFCEVSGFDEGYIRPSIEDIELGYRLRAAGHAIRLEKSLQVKHWKRWDLRSIVSTDFLHRAVPWTQLIHRYRGFVNDLNTSASSRASVAVTFLLAGALVGALWEPLLLLLAAGMAATLVALNARLYQFFLEKRGVWFAVQAVPWHWFYFLYCGIGFIMGTGRHFRSAGHRVERSRPIAPSSQPRV